jgi:hypothetical protein
MIDTEIKSLFEYCPETGILFWKEAPKYKPTLKGKTVGCKDSAGYLVTRRKGRNYYIHRLIWFYVHGYWPEYIDHINGDRSDNRIENLRECSNQQNNNNKGKPKSNTSGYKGVTWDKRSNRWVAQIQVGEFHIHLGSFKDKNQASEAYRQSAIKYQGDFVHDSVSLGYREQHVE